MLPDPIRYTIDLQAGPFDQKVEFRLGDGFVNISDPATCHTMLRGPSKRDGVFTMRVEWVDFFCGMDATELEVFVGEKRKGRCNLPTPMTVQTRDAVQIGLIARIGVDGAWEMSVQSVEVLEWRGM